MTFANTTIDGVHFVELERNEDPRGYFARAFCVAEFEAEGIPFSIAQVNLSRSIGIGTIRGMHYQDEMMHESKLVRCVRGTVWDVIVDMRMGSPTHGRYLAFELSEHNGIAICIPDGVAHGHQALTDEADMLYLMDGAYQRGHERGLRYDDPAIGIKWPLPAGMISEKDLAWPLIAR